MGPGARAGPAAVRPGAGGGTSAELVADALDALVDAAARACSLPSPPRQRPTDRKSGRAGLAALGRSATRSGPSRRPDLTSWPSRSLAAWQRDAVAGRVRACFRLVEPPETEENPDTWRLEFALQATDQPSLLVDAERVWGASGALKALARHLDSPQETLLTELGRASRLYPELDDSLRTAKPTGLDLDPDEAHRFLREGAPMLAGAGFGVLLPGWWSKPRARLGARLSASAPTAPGTVAAAELARPATPLWTTSGSWPWATSR